MPKVDYCGKEISENGLRMSTKKIAKVLDFPKPLTAGQTIFTTLCHVIHK